MSLLRIAVAKTHKYASRESGDTLEVVERPSGGISLVAVDGQGTGLAAKSLSMLVSGKAVSLIKDGGRDDVVARAASDYLFAFRHGKVSSTLDIVTVDWLSNTLSVTRNSPVPLVVVHNGIAELLASNAPPIGLQKDTAPTTHQWPLVVGLRVIVLTDGVSQAGRVSGSPLDLAQTIEILMKTESDPSRFADSILRAAIDADEGRPRDDMSVAVVAADQEQDDGHIRVRRMAVSLDLPG